MSWRTVVITKQCKLDLKLGQMVVRGEETIQINLNEMAVLVIENTAVSLTACLLSELSARKIKVIFCDVNPNQKKILAALHNQMGQLMLNGEYFRKTKQIFADLEQYWEELAEEFSYPVVYTHSPEPTALLKACGSQLEEECDSLLEQLDSYISASQEFLKKDLFVFVNLSAYLNREELSRLYKSAAYKKCLLLLIESTYKEPITEESIIVLDNDLCQLNLGWQS